MTEGDVTIVGAGVVGLAVAARLATPGRETFVVERRGGFGRETSSRTSEVVHAGLYYAPGSLKARLCVEGNRLLYELCAREGVPHRRLGKIVVATTAEEERALEALLARGNDAGAEGLRLLDASEARAIEPHVRARAALLSASSGVVDSHELMRRLATRAEARAARLVYGTRVVAIEPAREGLRVTTEDTRGERFTHATRVLVNAAGLGADAVAALAGIDVDAAGYRQHWCKGDWFSLAPRKARLIARLVYPAPDAGAPGLGVHTTTDLAGRVRLGPDATYVERGAQDYRVDPGKRDLFASAARRFLPFVEPADLEPDMAGIRPKLAGPGQAPRDFVIVHEAARRLPGLVNLVGIESPGLTAALAIARHVHDLVDGAGLLD